MLVKTHFLQDYSQEVLICMVICIVVNLQNVSCIVYHKFVGKYECRENMNACTYILET